MERPHCHAEDLSGVPVRVTGSSPLTDTDRHFLDVIARAVQARFTKENPMKYRSKPRTVDAAQWNPTVPAAIGAVIGIVITANEDYRHEGDGLAVVTDGGAFTAQDGDWVVLDDGQLRHFTARQFEARYEKSYPTHMRGPEPLVG